MSLATVIAGWTRRDLHDRGRVQVHAFDPALLWDTVALLAWGLVMVYSASIAMADNPRFLRYTPTYFLNRHAVFLALSFIAGLLASQVSTFTWKASRPAMNDSTRNTACRYRK